MTASPFDGAAIVHRYTRAQAFADGVLVDVSEQAREAGFRIPVALSAAVWADCVAWDQTAEALPLDEAGRLWDLLFLTRLEAHRCPDCQHLRVGLLRVPRGGRRPEPVELKAQLGPGDAGEPVLTMLLPEED